MHSLGCKGCQVEDLGFRAVIVVVILEAKALGLGFSGYEIIHLVVIIMIISTVSLL